MKTETTKISIEGGDAAMRVINGTTYVAGFVTGSGLSVIELK